MTETLSALIDPARMDALRSTGLLEPKGDAVLDRLPRVASPVAGAPRSYISLVTDRGQTYLGMVAHDRMDQPESRSTDLSGSFYQFAVATAEPLVIDDAQSNALVRDLPGNPDGSIGAYAGIPLRTRRGHGVRGCDGGGTQAGQTTETNGVADLGQTVQRAVRSALAASASSGIDVQIPARPLAITCDPLALEQSLTHLFITALHRAKDDVPVFVSVRGGDDTATVVVRADGAKGPAGQLARAVGRVHASSFAGSSDEPARVSMLRGGISVEAGTVKVVSSPHGLSFTATWPLVEGR